jgi:hypothetical protein
MAHELIKDYGGIDGREEHVCTAETKPGDLVVTSTGRFGLVLGHKTFETGEVCPVTTDALIDVDSASATTVSAAAAVFYNTTTKLAVTSGAHPGLGLAARAKTSGQLKMRVRINKANLAAGT